MSEKSYNFAKVLGEQFKEAPSFDILMSWIKPKSNDRLGLKNCKNALERYTAYNHYYKLILMSYLPLLSALIPAIALLGYICWRDRQSPEPLKQLLKAIAMGVLAIPLTLAIALPLQAIGVIPEYYEGIGGAILHAFSCAAIPEELAKLLLLWLFLRRNTYFDERMDGIVYAVCVSLGFAGLENVMYVLGDADWMTVAVSRAFTAVPGHFCFGVVMGYFYSLAKFEPQRRVWYSAMAFVAPMLAHGIYDAILFVIGENLPTGAVLLLMLAFLVFCFYLWKWASRSIKKHVG